MSGVVGTGVQSQGNAILNVGGAQSSRLVDLLMAQDIEPGSAPGYELCKTIYSYHPLGSKLADAPITMAQSQVREIGVACLGETMLVKAFNRTWDKISGIGASVVIHNAVKTSRIYGISSLAVGTRGVDPAEPLDLETLANQELYFNVLDPLNTAGSLVLQQDPNAPDFLKANYIRVAGKRYHPSRTCVIMNEQPIYIEWSTSAFGFVGRSVYQRALYPLKTFVQSMITDQMVTQKAGLLIAKMKTPGTILDNEMLGQANAKRGQLKSGQTGQVASIGIEESIETLNMQNVEGAGKFARENMLKNIATAANMPASMVNNETLAEGFGEGAEDAKQIARYIDYIRVEMNPVYDFMDAIVMRQAWSPEFFESLQAIYPEYRKISYDRAFYEWKSAFVAKWPNLLIEPDSEKVKVDDTRFKSVVAMVEILGPMLDPENKAKLLMWAAENANERKELFASKLDFDEQAIVNYQPPASPQETAREPMAFESEE
jgi:hypothetical protein